MIGVLVETDSLAHVLYRLGEDSASAMHEDPWGVEMSHLVRRDGRWRIALTRGGPLTSPLTLLDDKEGLVPPPSPPRRRR